MQDKQADVKTNVKPIYKNIWFWAIVVMVLAVIGAYGNKNNINNVVSKKPTAINKSLSSFAPIENKVSNIDDKPNNVNNKTNNVLALSVDELLKEYLDNEEATRNKYKGNEYQFTGRLMKKNDASGKIKSIELGPIDQSLKHELVCTLNGQHSIAKHFKIGDRITVIGRFMNGSKNQSIVTPCIIKIN